MDGNELFIEVKMTRGPKSMPFFITTNELDCAGRLGGYWLYRLFRFGPEVQLYRIRAPLEDHLSLRPRVFVATGK